jgi:hypothetical protein
LLLRLQENLKDKSNPVSKCVNYTYYVGQYKNTTIFFLFATITFSPIKAHLIYSFLQSKDDTVSYAVKSVYLREATWQALVVGFVQGAPVTRLVQSEILNLQLPGTVS